MEFENNNLQSLKDIPKIIDNLKQSFELIENDDLNVKLKYIVKVIAIECEARRVSIMMPSKKFTGTGKLLIKASVGIWDEVIKIVNESKKVTVSPVAVYVFKTGKTILFNTELELDAFLKKDSKFDFFSFKRKENNVFCSLPFIMSPIGEEKKILGVLNISDKDNFSAWDIEFIKEITKLIVEIIKKSLA